MKMKSTKLLRIAFLVVSMGGFAIPAMALENNGVALYRDLGSDLFLVGLNLESRTSDTTTIMSPGRAKTLDIRFLDGMSKRRWASLWTQSIAINASRDQLVSTAQDLSDILSAFKGNLAAGDKVEFILTPGSGTSVKVNDIELVAGKSPEAINLFLSALIGPVPPSSQFKNALLGKEDSAEEVARLNAITIPGDRVATIENWVSEAVEEPEPEVEPEPKPEPKPEPVVAKTAPEPEPEPAPKPAPATKTAVVESTAPVVEAETAVATATLAEAPVAANTTDTALAATEAVAEEEEEIDVSVESILLEQDYTSNIVGMIYKQVKYPARAVKRNQQDSIRAQIIVNSDGSIASLSITEESKFGLLNKEVLRAIEAAAPFPEFSNGYKADTMVINVPVAFKLAE